LYATLPALHSKKWNVSDMDEQYVCRYRVMCSIGCQEQMIFQINSAVRLIPERNDAAQKSI
jgi:hypothetical protein